MGFGARRVALEGRKAGTEGSTEVVVTKIVHEGSVGGYLPNTECSELSLLLVELRLRFVLLARAAQRHSARFQAL